MACKIDIKNTINKSIDNKVDFDFWGYSLSQAKNLTKFINDIWNTNILSYLQRDGRGSYQILKDESKIDEAVEIEYNKQLKAETKIAEIDREINERDLGIDEFGDSNPSYERVDYKNVSYQNSQFKPDNKAKTIEQSNTLFGLNTQNQEQLEFHLNTLNAVSQFLENAGIETRLISEFLSQDGNVVEGAIAAANFIEGTVDIIDDLEKGRAEAWNKLPEEAAHWWYRLLDKNSELKDALLTSALTDRKEEELRNSLYGETYKDGPKVIGKLALDSNGNVTSKPALSAIREEAIGQLIAEAIKRIETKNAAPEDYSFFKKFLEWINSIIDIFKTTNQDPFEVAAMKILSSDMSDLMTWEEYRKVNNIVNFADVLTEQSVAPVDYTLIEDIGFIGSTFMEDNYGNATSGYRFHFKDSNWVQKYGNSSPSFYTQQELDNWVSVNIKEHDIRQKQQIQEVRDNQIFFDRLLNKTFRKKSKFLPKTLRKYYDIIDAQNLNQLREWNISQELQQITKKLSEQEKKQIIETNGYTNIAPTLKVLPDLLKKYGRKTTPEIIKQEIEITNKLVKNEITKEQATELRQKLENKKKGNSIVLSEPIKIDGAKKQELSILNGIKEMIKLENPNLKSITAEEFVNEAHNWLETNYLLGFANEKSYLSYRTDQTFTHISDRQTNEDVDITNLTNEEIQRLPFEERQRIANIVGLTKQNPDVYHNKVSLRFNDMYHLKSGHFDKSPSAWGNLTYFYTGKNKWKDAVLLHEIQNDNIEALREFKAEKVDLETSLGRYLQQLNTDLLNNITQIESGGKKIQKKFDINPKRTHIQLNYQLEQIKDLPLEQGLQQLKQRLNELIELFKSDFSKDINKAKENVDEAYSQRRKFQDFQKRGGIKSLLTKEELNDLKIFIKGINEENLDLRNKKQEFRVQSGYIQSKINSKLRELYGDNAPVITLQAPAKPLPRSQRNMRTVGYGQNQMRIGGASQELNENVNFLIAYSEKQISTQLSKNIEDNKRNYISARNATVANNFNVALSKITPEQYATLIENYKYNEDLLDGLIKKQAQKDIEKESVDISKLSDEEIENQLIQNPRIIDPLGLEAAFDTRDNYEYLFKGKKYKSKTAIPLSKKEVVQMIRAESDKNINIADQQEKFEDLKQKALDKKEEFEKNYGKIEEEVKQTLEVEMNYFTPLVHHLIQKHINQYGKDFPMYFSGYNITKLTQGNDRTAMIYAGKDEINIVDKSNFTLDKNRYEFTEGSESWQKSYYKGSIDSLPENDENIDEKEYEKAYQQATERRAKEIKFRAAKEIGLLNYSDFGFEMGYDYELQKLTDKQLEEGIKKLNEYKKQSKQNMDRVINTIMNVSDSKPIETGAIYNAMTQISGVKLIWQDKIDGLKGNTGGYLVDLTNYNYNVPILYGLQNNKPRDLTSIQFQKLTAEEKARTIEQVTKEHRSITAIKDLSAKLAHRIGGRNEVSNVKPDVILPIGTSGSGKSTFIKSLPQENLVVIEPDAMRVEFTREEQINQKLQELINNKEIEKDCTGKLKAEKGLATSFAKGGTWKVIKDLKGYPTHKEGGVDLTIGKGGVSIKNGNTQFTAKYGLVIPKAQEGLVIPKSKYKPTKSSDPNATYLSIPNKESFYNNEEDLDIFWDKYKKRQDLNGYLSDYGKDSKGEYISLYKKDGNILTNLFSTPNEYYDRVYKSDLDALKNKRFNTSFDIAYKKKDYTTLKNMTIPNNTIKELKQPSYEEQRQWYMNYIKSPLYKETLLNEYRQSGKDVKEVDSEILNRYNRVKNVPIEEVQIHPKGYGYIRGITYLSENNPNEINNQTGKTDNIYNQRNPEGWGKYQIGHIHLDPSAKFLDTYIAGHELIHKSTEGNKYLTNSARNKLLSSVNKDNFGDGYTDKELNKSYSYYDNPTEVHARLSELKYMMNQYGIYNPTKEKMTKEHLIKAMKNPYIRKSIDFNIILDMLQNKGDIIDLMNTIAQNKTDGQEQNVV